MSEFSSTDEKIIKATFSILQKEGFAKATTKKIAAEAGVNEVTIFRNFQHKNNLVEVTKEYYLQIFLRSFYSHHSNNRELYLKFYQCVIYCKLIVVLYN